MNEQVKSKRPRKLFGKLNSIQGLKLTRFREELKRDLNKNIDLLKCLKKDKGFYGVIRSKGGSGEHHYTRHLCNDLAENSSEPLICYQNKDVHYSGKQSEEYGTPIQLSELTSSKGRAYLQTSFSPLSELFITRLAKSNYKNVIFTEGTCSGAGMFSNFRVLSLFCNTVFVTVSANVRSSFAPAIRLAEIYSSENLNFVVWNEEYRGEDVYYRKAILTPRELIQKFESSC